MKHILITGDCKVEHIWYIVNCGTGFFTVWSKLTHVDNIKENAIFWPDSYDRRLKYILSIER